MHRKFSSECNIVNAALDKHKDFFPLILNVKFEKNIILLP